MLYYEILDVVVNERTLLYLFRATQITTPFCQKGFRQPEDGRNVAWFPGVRGPWRSDVTWSMTDVEQWPALGRIEGLLCSPGNSVTRYLSHVLMAS